MDTTQNSYKRYNKSLNCQTGPNQIKSCKFQVLLHDIQKDNITIHFWFLHKQSPPQDFIIRNLDVPISFESFYSELTIILKMVVNLPSQWKHLKIIAFMTFWFINLSNCSLLHKIEERLNRWMDCYLFLHRNDAQIANAKTK